MVKIKTVNVMVMIQMDVNPERTLADVVTGLDSINGLLQRNQEDCFNAQIFANNVDDSDILEPITDWEIGDNAICPEPNEDDLWTYGGWLGNIKDIKEIDGEMCAQLEDGDGDVWDIELSRLIPDED